VRVPCAVCALLLALGVRASAELLPSFHLDDRAWEATHIVVVSEGGTIDGEVTVLESWWGDLPKGTALRLPDLKVYATEGSRAISDFCGKVPEHGPKSVTCARMVLFLRRDGESWLPAAKWGGFDVSVVWIESGRTFARVQVMNPGERLLIDLDMDEPAMKEKAIERASARAAANAALAKIRATDDAATRAKEALAFAAETEHYAARLEAFEIVAACGEAATPHLAAALTDDAFGAVRRDVVKALGAVGGEGAGEALTALLHREAKFWTERGPALERGWWNGRDAGLRDRYCVAYEALQSLQKLRYDRCKETVTEVLLCWSSLPQLGEEVPQLVETCEELLRDLSSG